MPGLGLDGGILRLACVGMEPSEGAEYMGTDGKDNGTGGRHPTGLGDVSQGGGAGIPPVRVVDIGGDPLHEQAPGGVSAQSRQAY